MKKMMKSAVCAVMAVLLVLSLVACGGTKKLTPEEVVTAYYQAVGELDFVTVSSLRVDGEEISAEMEEKEITDRNSFLFYILKEQAGMGSVMSDEAIKAFATTIGNVYDKAMENMAVEIVDVKENAANTVITVTVKTPDIDKLIIGEDVAEDANAENPEGENLETQEPENTGVEGALTAAIAELGYANVGSHEELSDDDWNKIFGRFEEIFLKELENVEIKETTNEVVLVEVDGNWLVDPGVAEA